MNSKALAIAMRTFFVNVQEREEEAYNIKAFVVRYSHPCF